MAIITHTIVVKGELTDLNDFIKIERSNRYKGAQVKRENTEYVMWQTKGLPKVTKYPLHVHIHWHTRNERIDPDNVAFAKKFILDGLVENGIIKDDSRKFITGFSDEFSVDKDKPRIVIQLTSNSR